jgi:hypothetical protein
MKILIDLEETAPPDFTEKTGREDYQDSVEQL